MKRLALLVCFLIAPIAICAPPARPIAYFGIEFRWGDAANDRFLHVARVTPNGPAAKAGIQPGDLITHVAGVRVDFGDELDFLLFMKKRRAGERLSVTVVRLGKTATRVVTLGALPEPARERWEINFRVAQERRGAARTQPRQK